MASAQVAAVEIHSPGELTAAEGKKVYGSHYYHTQVLEAVAAKEDKQSQNEKLASHIAILGGARSEEMLLESKQV